LFCGINKARLRIKIETSIIFLINNKYISVKNPQKSYKKVVNLFYSKLKELLTHFSKEDYKQEYMYNYSKKYFKDKLIGNFNAINFALSL
jgi:hypothetical protein